MPHLSIEYSANLESEIDMAAFCDRLREAAIETGAFAKAGIRVRAIRCEHYAIADGSPGHGFIDMSVRLRGGRTLDVRKAATEAIFAAARDHLADLIKTRPIALSLEMRDIDPELSPKLNTIRDHIDGA
ncbi:5-carboxymethyl-2-hydroxymuconate Delta-isomerase [Nitratireductor sp. XY-223]|uniref:5-carboxymethyl-2-hydroxymuconate Delta-isomerase n=1 Tax=Nitratireductor sp. XY-223 TaxID=2561926 RepID=UPI0010AA7826|nr:5-carboxymethyl-2-hydroxymuconate Delta-isomerase [Nitratireductor sp. XY-223]